MDHGSWLHLGAVQSFQLEDSTWVPKKEFKGDTLDELGWSIALNSNATKLFVSRSGYTFLIYRRNRATFSQQT